MRSDGGIIASKEGFTLIEILVAVAILAMIFGIVFGIFFHIMNSAEEQEERAAIYHKANFILNNISQNAASAYIPFAGQYGGEETDLPVFLGTQAESEGAPVDSLSLFTTNSRFAGATLAGEIAYVRYEAAEEALDSEPAPDDENNPFALNCVVSPLFTAKEEGDEVPQWTLNVRSLAFEYFDGSAWAPGWDYAEQEAFPSALKATLEIADSRGNPYTFSTIACIPFDTPLQELEDAEDEQEEEENQEEQEEMQQEEEILPPEEDENPQGDAATENEQVLFPNPQ
jgi:prepilin-type N-terminal cleavage/methylation domain-containing protein